MVPKWADEIKYPQAFMFAFKKKFQFNNFNLGKVTFVSCFSWET